MEKFINCEHTAIHDNDRIIYVRGNGFLTESGMWSPDIVNAALFNEETAVDKRKRIIAASEGVYNPVILTWN